MVTEKAAINTRNNASKQHPIEYSTDEEELVRETDWIVKKK